jgi:hypothetical protein
MLDGGIMAVSLKVENLRKGAEGSLLEELKELHQEMLGLL